MPENKKHEQFGEMPQEYWDLAHAMQTGVKFEMEWEEKEGEQNPTSPKHLRVGVNMSLLETGAIVRMLVKKGVFTYEEYTEQLLELLRVEKEKYETKLSEMTGQKVVLQ